VDATELLRRVISDMQARETELAELAGRINTIQAEFADLSVQRRALQDLISRYGDDAEAKAHSAEVDNAEVRQWRRLSKGDAVERALREGGEMSPAAIVEYLVGRGRDRDSTANISAAISHVKRTRETVERVGPARWKYREPKKAQSPTEVAARLLQRFAVSQEAMRKLQSGSIVIPRQLRES
jgi:N-methylhydantoinase B/oxoprolinase/acetone carboxylase alpha subunit